MRSFIKGKKLWRYLTDDITIHVQTASKTQPKFVERLEDWDSKNNQIIIWFCNTSVLSIYQQFGCYNTAKEIWDLLAHRYTTADLSRQYQLHNSLHWMKQEPGQSINRFFSQMHGIWDQLELSEPSWTCSEDSAHFIVYRDRFRLIQFLMSLTYAYESVRSSVVHQSTLPTLDNFVAKLHFEETRRGLLQTRYPDTVLVTLSRPSHIFSPSSALRHSIVRLVLVISHKTIPITLKKWSKNISSTSAPSKSGIQYRFKPSSHFAATIDDVLNDSSSSALSVNDVAEIVKQITYTSSTLSSYALSVTSVCRIQRQAKLLGSAIKLDDYLSSSIYHPSSSYHSASVCCLFSIASDGYYLSQAYASNLISCAGLTYSKIASTPLEPNVQFTPLDDTPLRDPTLYRTLVGNLVYLSITRPDIAYDVHLVS
ncbi:hypothetical protein RJ639_010180 [Escallonia herrerae]|uniref:UBN2_3 domain-containing protein n=1 Tax=Escallonia herrerae TaxID=1293975 RepID=A0AA89AX59_9ASTE|nr:hypothetical protein RJ639_010180 [Escallonia herrerae]